MNCIFCKIINGDLPATLSYQNEHVVAFQDIHPQAPHHHLIVPRKHISTLNDISKDDPILLGHMVESASVLAKQLGMSEQGYRVVMNCNAGAGQTVFHIHLHLLGGRAMTWPPG